MRVFMLKDVERVGMAGQVVNVSDGYASNFLLPRKLAIKANSGTVEQYKEKVQKAEVTTKVLNSKAAMIAERVRNMHLTIKKKTHDDNKLYGAVSADEVVDILKEKDVPVNRKQIEFVKSIRTTGEHKVTIRLSSKLKPELTLKVVGE
jgi:large subunit ribosomal protein L9